MACITLLVGVTHLFIRILNPVSCVYMDGAEARVDFDVDTYAVYWGKARVYPRDGCDFYAFTQEK